MSQPSYTLVDTHCHLDFTDFDTDRPSVLQQCQQHNINHIIVPAVSAATWDRTIEVCSLSNALHSALGMHPVFIDQHQPHHLIQLDRLIQQSKPVAIGEIGLDFYLKHLDREKQSLFFSKQLIIAKQHGLPVIIHNRKAHDECLHILKDTPVKGGIIHAFNGSIQQAEKYRELGFVLGFGGMITYTRSKKLHGLLKRLPLEAIVLETDAPDMTVANHKGQRNSPAYLPHVLKAVADLKGISEREVAEQTTQNANRVFNRRFD